MRRGVPPIVVDEAMAGGPPFVATDEGDAA